MSSTPRTDAWKRANRCANWPEVGTSPFNLCRELERELAAANARVKELEAYAQRLEEAGEWAVNEGDYHNHLAAIRAWNAAKKTKP